MSDDQKFVETVLTRLRAAIGNPTTPVALHEPQFVGKEWQYVKECLDTGWVSSVGQFVDRFERELCNFTGTDHAVAVVNGTAALHICLKLAGVEADDEVLMPSLNFVAMANATSYCNAIPHFVDVEECTLGTSPQAVESHLVEIAQLREGACFNRQTGRRIRALVPMHSFGHPADLAALLAVAERFNLQLVEDAAESLGSCYRGRHTGNVGVTAALSFNGNKVATTGGGGAVLTNDPELAKLARHLTTTAKLPHRWNFDHDMVGYNYRLPNINAALGCAQLEAVPAAIAKKRELFERYHASFAGVPGLRVFKEPEHGTSNYWLQTLLLDATHARFRDSILAATNDAGIMTRPVWTPMHQMRQFANCPRMLLPVTESLQHRIINVPSSPQILND